VNPGRADAARPAIPGGIEMNEEKKSPGSRAAGEHVSRLENGRSQKEGSEMPAQRRPLPALSVQFHHMPPSNSVKELIRQQAERLRRFGPAESRCAVEVDRRCGRHRDTIFTLIVRLTVPGKRGVAAHVKLKSFSREYLHASVRLAFDEIERYLERRNRRILRREKRSLAA
jgi:hypothetical protein